MKKKSATKADSASQEAKRKPVRILREGDCSVSIWAREVSVQGTPRVYYSLTAERSYKDASGQWHYTKSFDPESILRVIALCERAQQAIAEMQQAQ